MANRIQRGWELTKQSLQILKANKQILLFPIISGIVCSAILSLIVRPLWHIEYNYLQTGQQHALSTTLGIIALIVALFVCNLIVIFCNAALIATIANYFKTQKLSLRYGLKAAKACFPAIIAWTLFNTTIGFTLRTFQSRLGQIAAIAAVLLGIAWTIVSYFIVPILVLEKIGPITAIKQSAHVLHKTWGRSLISTIGLGLILFIARLMVLTPLAIGIYIGGGHHIFIALMISVVLLVILTIISSAAKNILRTALYLYATDNNIALPYNINTIKHAFRSRELKSTS